MWYSLCILGFLKTSIDGCSLYCKSTSLPNSLFQVHPFCQISLLKAQESSFKNQLPWLTLPSLYPTQSFPFEIVALFSLLGSFSVLPIPPDKATFNRLFRWERDKIVWQLRHWLTILELCVTFTSPMHYNSTQIVTYLAKL